MRNESASQARARSKANGTQRINKQSKPDQKQCAEVSNSASVLARAAFAFSFSPPEPLGACGFGAGAGVRRLAISFVPYWDMQPTMQICTTF
jgi:hypothetical protein